MNEQIAHWTERSVKDFLYRIGADFVLQLEDRMESYGLKQVDLAERLDLTEGRVSQIINNPGNLTLGMIIKCARAVDMKVTIVAYDDNDSKNIQGPINSDIFRICWEKAGKPLDFWSLEDVQVLEAEEVAVTAPATSMVRRGYTAVDDPFGPFTFSNVTTSVSTFAFSSNPYGYQNDPKPLAA